MKVSRQKEVTEVFPGPALLSLRGIFRVLQNNYGYRMSAVAVAPAHNSVPRKPRSLMHPSAFAALLLTLAVVVAALYLQNFSLPAPTGPYPVGTTILSMTDNSRPEDHSSDPADRRELVVQLWYPAAPSRAPIAPYERWREATPAMFYASLLQTHSRLEAPIATETAPFPVLIFGHRWNGQRTQNTDLAEELASHGYVVASIDHPYNSARVELADGRVIKGIEAIEGPQGAAASASEQIAYWNHTLDVWAADDLFVLNQLAAMSSNIANRFHDRLDTNHAGAFGHSFGGAVALRLCGLDPRIKAGVNLDGWTFGALKNRTAEQSILIEYERVTAERRQQLASLPQPGNIDDQMDRADFAAIDENIQQFGGERLYIAGSQHMDFTDQPLLPPLRRLSFTGPIAPHRMETILRQTVLGFFEQSLRNEPSALLAAPHAAFPEMTDDITQPAKARGAYHPTQP